MANKKFSEFTSQTDSANVQFVVGYNGSDNVRISPSNLLGAYLPLAGGTLTGNLVFNDNVIANFGTGLDLKIKHDGTDSYIQNLTGNLEITNNSDDKDIIFRSDDGSGSLGEYFRVDGSETNILFSKPARFIDSIAAQFGTDSDLIIKHDNTDAKIDNFTGDLYIRNFSDDKDIIFQSDDGAAGVATYFFLDGSKVNGSSILGATVFPDKSKIYVGTSGDLEIFHNGSQTYIENYTGTFNITQHTNDGDIVFKCDDGSGGVTSYLTLDGSTTHSYFSAGNVGIGTTAPSHPLDVKGEDTDNATIARFYSNTSTRGAFGIKNGVSVSPSIFIGTLGGSEQLAIGVNSTESIRINGSGNVGIGTNAPVTKLNVNGGISITSGQSFDFVDTSLGANSIKRNTTVGGLEISTGSSASMNILDNGNTGIGTNAPTAKLQVVGLAEHADNSAATTAGLTAGAFYRTGDLLKVVH